MKLSAFIALGSILLMAGCTSFTPLRSARFVDDDNNYLQVDYGQDREDHESVFYLGNGGSMKFRSKLKVRVELPGGDRFTAYQNMSTTGMLYKTDDAEWEYFESGTGCIVARLAKEKDGYVRVFSGVLCASVRNPENMLKEKIRSGGSTPRGFGRDSSGPRTVEENK